MGPHLTVWPRPRPTCMPRFILIHPTVSPQYTNVTDRQDRQRSDSIGQTVLQMVTQKCTNGRKGDILKLSTLKMSYLSFIA